MSTELSRASRQNVSTGRLMRRPVVALVVAIAIVCAELIGIAVWAQSDRTDAAVLMSCAACHD